MKKISCWEDLIDAKLVTTRGLYAKVTDEGDCYTTKIYYKDEMNNIGSIIELDWAYDLEKVIKIMCKFGFDLEYEAPFNLVEFLRENLCKQTFRVDDFNYYFMIYNDKILLNRETDVQIIGILYIKPKLKDIVTTIERNFEIITTIERKLEEEKVTKIQLIHALEELGWM